MPTPADVDLLAELATYHHDPYGYVLFAWPWGVEGRGLADSPGGPRGWQTNILQETGRLLQERVPLEAALGWAMQAIQFSVASGHDIGKSALVAFLTKWALDTFEDTRVAITANTEPQLRTKTWPELIKWNRLSISGHLWKPTAMSLHSVDKDHEKNWRADAMTWSEENTEAFAGLHNRGKRMVIFFDEASAIVDEIFRVTEGALTDDMTEMLWFCFGNPTRNTGRFKDHFERLKKYWILKQIDSRTVDGTNKIMLNQLVEIYGEDSDFVRKRITGQFPRAGAMQFIPSDHISAARVREGESHLRDPLIMGVDVARFGNDNSEIINRRGKNARDWGRWTYQGLDTMQLAARVAHHATYEGDNRRPDAMFVDEGGVGGGVVDRLRQLGFNVFGINFGSRSDIGGRRDFGSGGERYANKRAEIWGHLRVALREGLAIPDEDEWQKQLEAPEYDFNNRGEILLESKKDMKRRLGEDASPDKADALALTYALPVLYSGLGASVDQNLQTKHEWDPFADM